MPRQSYDYMLDPPDDPEEDPCDMCDELPADCDCHDGDDCDVCNEPPTACACRDVCDEPDEPDVYDGPEVDYMYDPFQYGD